MRRAHGFGGDQNVGENDDGIDAQTAKGLQRDFGGKFRRLRDFQKGVLLRAARGIRADSVPPGASSTPARAEQVRGGRRAGTATCGFGEAGHAF